MGLMGPSWSWEEWQKKEAVLSDLEKEANKQTDKLLAGMRAMEKEKMDQIQMQQRLEEAAKMAALYDSLNDIEKAAYNSVTKEARILFKDSVRSKIIVGKYLEAIKTKHIFTPIGKKLLLAGSVLILVIFFIMTIFNSNIVNPYIADLIIFNIIFLVLGVYNIPMHIIPAKMSANTIKKTKCCQKLLAELKKINTNNILYIGVNANCLRVIDKNGKKIDYQFLDYGFPNLPTYKYGILLSTILKETNLNKKLKLVISTTKKPQMNYMFYVYSVINKISFAYRLSEPNDNVFSFKEQDMGETLAYNHIAYATTILDDNTVDRAKKTIKGNVRSKINIIQKKNDIRKGKTW